MATAGEGPQRPALPSAREMAASSRDVWGEAALRQPGGPSYEFFAGLLPPLRYVNTAFRHYPVVLSAPRGAVKARWVSNGSAVNARADSKPMWREVGFPVRFLVGEPAEPFGDDLARLDGPRYVGDYLPVVQVAYTRGKVTYEQEAFMPVGGAAADCGAVFLRFRSRGAPGAIVARLEVEGPVRAADGAVRDAKGQGLLLFGAGWEWDGDRKELRAPLAPGRRVVLAVLTRPVPSPPALNAELYDRERRACLKTWEELLGRGMRLEIPEPVVQGAWRALVVGQFLIASGDRMNYSAGNAYDHLYEAECGDAVRSLLLYGFGREARGMVRPLLDFNRAATRFHVAGHKLQLLTHHYWLTRDADYLRATEPSWGKAVDLIRNNRGKENGLLPKDNYAGDVKRQVYSLNSNANCWRGLRDLAAVLEDVGERERARQLAREAREFREAILAAVARSERRDAKPPFIPMALLDDEAPYEVLNATRLGSYYDLIAPYVLGSEVFGPGAEREGWMIEYFRQNGGLAMGMVRTTPQQGQFKGEPGVNVLYGLRYQLALLRRDDRAHALVGFYGHLAQGMTRGTFVGGEGSRFLHGDKQGRSFYLPPNSASNAAFLTVLRYLLVQDWDLDGDGRPETLRLLYGAPGRWLRDGAVLKVGRAPTAFGEVSLRAESRLGRGEVLVTVEPPPRRPEKLLLRPALPEGWKVVAAQAGDSTLSLAPDGAVDLSSHRKPVTIRFEVRRQKP